jgi:hypothetical protein
VGAELSSTSCGLGVFVDQSAEPIAASEVKRGRRRRARCCSRSLVSSRARLAVWVRVAPKAAVNGVG